MTEKETATVVMMNKTADDFVNTIIAAMEQDPTIPRVHIEATDRVLRPFLKLLDEAQETNTPVTDVESAVASTVSTVIMNLVGRIVPRDSLDDAADKAEEMLGHIAAMLSESIAASYIMPGQGSAAPH